MREVNTLVRYFRFTFTSLVDILIGIANSAEGLNICVIIAGIKKYKSIIKKKRNKHDKIVLLAKDEFGESCVKRI